MGLAVPGVSQHTWNPSRAIRVLVTTGSQAGLRLTGQPPTAQLTTCWFQQHNWAPAVTSTRCFPLRPCLLSALTAGVKSRPCCHALNSHQRALAVPNGSKTKMATLKDKLLVNLPEEEEGHLNKITVVGLVLLVWLVSSVS